MIFVTVGTHEQPFDRLIKEIDNLKGKNIIEDEIIIQKGYSKYIPKYCQYKNFYSFDEMSFFYKRARIIITHAGPSSIIEALSEGKIPIVVPRKKEFGEHVDNHQVEFTKFLYQEKKIIPIFNIKDLKNAILNYDKIVSQLNKNLSTNYKIKIATFCQKLEEIIIELLK